MTCTWHEKDSGRCTSIATHPQLDKLGYTWANLCGVHDNALQGAIKDPDVRKMLSAWVKASGGAKKLASTF